MSAALNTTSPPGTLNPYTPLAFLPPDISSQFEVSRYLYAVTLGGYLWDVAVNLGNDYKLLFEHRIRLPTVVYYISRVSTLTYILTSFIFQVGNVRDCQALQIALGIFFVTTQGATSWLFLLRVQAIWHRNRFVIAIFFILWLAVIGGAITVPAGIRGAHIGPTQACINVVVPDSVQAAVIIPMINDSAVFIAISYRIVTYSTVEESFKARLRAFFGVGSVPRLSRALLQGGQHYYLIAVCGNVLLLVLVSLPGIPTVYRAMCTIPVLATINAMACIVFRKIKFGLITPDGTTQARTLTTGRFAPPENSLPMHFRHKYSVTDPTRSFTLPSARGGAEVAGGMGADINVPLEVHVIKEEHQYDNKGTKISRSSTEYDNAV